jgi:hypothetical protein
MTDNPDLHCGRGWLARASDVLTGAEDYMSAVEYAHAAAVIGNGYVNLAHASQALEALASTARRRALFDAAAEREERAAEEARPHDDSEKPDGVVYVVEGEEHGALYGAASVALARDWIATYGPNSYPGVNLSVTALAVER